MHEACLNTHIHTHLQFENSRSLAKHHFHKVPVVDGVAGTIRHLRDHFLHLQMSLWHTQLLHHSLQAHHVWKHKQNTTNKLLQLDK